MGRRLMEMGIAENNFENVREAVDALRTALEGTSQ
jgi:hypothetical protein